MLPTSAWMMFSLTSHDLPPEIKGKLREDTQEITLRINAIAYNVSMEKMQAVFQKFGIYE